MTSYRSRLLRTSITLFSAWAPTTCGPNTPSTIQIGVAQPLSGPSAARGQDLLNGAKGVILQEATAFGTPMARDVAAALSKLDKKVEFTEAVDNNTTDFAAFVNKLKAGLTRPQPSERDWRCTSRCGSDIQLACDTRTVARCSCFPSR